MSVDFAQISSTEDQRPASTSPVKIRMNQNDAISGIEHSEDRPSDIRIVDSGIYVIIAAPQVGRLSGSEPRYADFWLRKNDTDVLNSNVRYVVGSSKDKDVIVNQSIMPLSEGDILNVMMCVEVADEGLGIEVIRPDGRPVIPSIILSMLKIKGYTKGYWVSTERGTGGRWVEEGMGERFAGK
jgi:hypothetical protein